MRKKTYLILTPHGFVRSRSPGKYAGWNARPDRRIFGRLDCASGKRKMRKENRVFFRSWEEAIACGFRPCKICKPSR